MRTEITWPEPLICPPGTVAVRIAPPPPLPPAPPSDPSSPPEPPPPVMVMVADATFPGTANCVHDPQLGLVQVCVIGPLAAAGNDAPASATAPLRRPSTA